MSEKKKIALAVVASSLTLFSNGLHAEEARMVQPVQEEELAYSDLGSGEEVRSDLVSQASSSKKANHSKKTADGQCGQTKKPTEGQCGEGTCGEGKTGGTKQPSEANCGEQGGDTSSNQSKANPSMKNRSTP
jgi:uncharacterized low-complexity protein